MNFWLSTIGHYLVTRALNRALNGVFGGDARGTKSKKTSTIGTCLAGSQLRNPPVKFRHER